MKSSMWFEKLTGFQEKSPEFVRANLKVVNDKFLSEANGKQFKFGSLEICTLQELRDDIELPSTDEKRIQLEEVVANVQELHAISENKHALFQAASQFNLLEMVSPNVTPEHGIDGYSYDRSQGPACAIACGAGTIYRNYFVPVGNQIGQTANQQIDCLDLIGEALENSAHDFWRMQNGYALAYERGLSKLNNSLTNYSKEQRDELKSKLKVGIQWNTEVTIAKPDQIVSQIYCSALPVAYCSAPSKAWEKFARLVLEATYEATFYAAVKNYNNNGCNLVYLTLVGGGAFGNETEWILDAIKSSLDKFKAVPLDIKIVSYGNSNPNLFQWMKKLKL